MNRAITSLLFIGFVSYILMQTQIVFAWDLKTFDVKDIPNNCKKYSATLPELTWPLPGKISDYGPPDKDRYINRKKHESIGTNNTSYTSHYLLDFGVPWHNEDGGSWRFANEGTDIKNKYSDSPLDGSTLLLHTGIDLMRKIDRASLRGTKKDVKDLSTSVTDSNGNDKDDNFASNKLPIYPIYSGTIVKAKSMDGWVGVVVINHKSSEDTEDSFTSTYWHIDISEDIQRKVETAEKNNKPIAIPVTTNTFLGTLADLDNPSVFDRDHLHLAIQKGIKKGNDPGSLEISEAGKDDLLDNELDHINPNNQCFSDKWKERDAFGDIDKIEPEYNKAIYNLWSQGIIRSHKTYIPDQFITRGEFSKILVRSIEIGEGRKLSKRTLPFDDVTESNVFKEHISKLYPAIVNGTSDKTFHPYFGSDINQIIEFTLKFKNLTEESLDELWSAYLDGTMEKVLPEVQKKVDITFKDLDLEFNKNLLRRNQMAKMVVKGLLQKEGIMPIYGDYFRAFQQCAIDNGLFFGKNISDAKNNIEYWNQFATRAEIAFAASTAINIFNKTKIKTTYCNTKATAAKNHVPYIVEMYEGTK